MGLSESKAPIERVALEIIGVGIDPSAHATLQAIKLIRNSTVIFCVPDHADFIESQKTTGTPCHIVTAHLRPGYPRSVCYNDIAREIFEYVNAASCVAWITSGDPTINCGVSEALIKLSIERNTHLRLTSGVSSLVAVNALVPSSERTDSFVQLNARHLYMDGLQLDVRFAHFVIQIFQSLSQNTTCALNARIGSLLPLQKQLLQFYAGEHVGYLVAAETKHSYGQVRRISVNTLNDNAEYFTPETTLFLPAGRSESGYVSALLEQWNTDDTSKFLAPLETLARIAKASEGGIDAS